ncbi:MAG: ammonium transporter, partial [bacterium]|nr:ammonium transporter [bacterium]
MVPRILKRSVVLSVVVATFALCVTTTPASADGITSGITGTLGTISAIDTLWVLMAAFFVFFMQAGFGMVEAGFIRSKNTCNILTKNFVDYCSASIMFFLVGYAFMFGTGNDFIGWDGFSLGGGAAGADGSAAVADNLPIWAF